MYIFQIYQKLIFEFCTEASHFEGIGHICVNCVHFWTNTCLFTVKKYSLVLTEDNLHPSTTAELCTLTKMQNLAIIHGMQRCMYVCSSITREPLNQSWPNLHHLKNLTPSMVGGLGGWSWSWSYKVKGHLKVKSWNLKESSTKVTRGHFKVTTKSRNPSSDLDQTCIIEY